jgi:hybrid cluster-associated redox disulfide protein
MDENRIVPEMNVKETLQRWPASASVFFKYRMGCVGCTMAEYETIASAAEIYQLALNRFIEDLQAAIEE